MSAIMDEAGSALRPIDRALTAELARSFPGADAIALELAGLASAAVGEGHSCLDLAALAQAREWTGAQLAGALESLRNWRAVSTGAALAPLVLADDSRLYLRRYWRYEQAVARDLRRLWRDRPAQPDEAAASAILERLFPGADGAGEGQRRAVAHALSHRLTVILGGPGTGKTHAVLSLLVALTRLGLVAPERVELAAPTGKAAARLSQSLHDAQAHPKHELEVLVGLPAQASTLHRLLGARPHTARVARDADDPLAQCRCRYRRAGRGCGAPAPQLPLRRAPGAGCGARCDPQRRRRSLARSAALRSDGPALDRACRAPARGTGARRRVVRAACRNRLAD
jgi:exodeoxyribonuclease V alpha subunit